MSSGNTSSLREKKENLIYVMMAARVRRIADNIFVKNLLQTL